MWNLVAETARRLALFAEHRADRLKHRALSANAAAEWWHDVSVWADGVDSWASLSRRRAARLRRPLTRGGER